MKIPNELCLFSSSSSSSRGVTTRERRILFCRALSFIHIFPREIPSYNNRVLSCSLTIYNILYYNNTRTIKDFVCIMYVYITYKDQKDRISKTMLIYILITYFDRKQLTPRVKLPVSRARIFFILIIIHA